MSTTTTTAPAATIVGNAPEGIVRVFVPTGLELSKLQLRTLAQKAAKTIDVGRTPVGKPARLNGVTGHSFDFAPVKRGGLVKPAAEVAPSDDPRIAVLTGLGLTPDMIAAVLATAPAAKVPAPKAPKAGAKAPKADREVPAFLRKWEGVTCKTCRDFGYIRGPKAGAKAGRPFRTAQTPETSPTAIPCPSHVAAPATGGKKKGRKATA